MNKAKKQVGIWIRVSTEDQARGDSPEHHEKRARYYAEAKDWEVVTVYHLEGVSGKHVADHPEAKRMMVDVKSGKVTGLVFSKLARLARNTKQLLEFSEFFREYNADLISLQEAIDTSSPAGRLFYTLIGAMAQWEREEIADRVKASIPIRAKMGKRLGGQAPFGYRWEGHTLELNETEAPIRKLMFELFLKHRTKNAVARALNEKGIRSRNGAKFSAWSIGRLLSDPIAKGLRRANYTHRDGDTQHWVLKPEDEWIFVKAPAIVSETIWEQVNTILAEHSKKYARPHRGVVHLFSGYVYCECGSKMYVLTDKKKHTCKQCRNKIVKEDLETIWHEQLQAYTVSEKDIARTLSEVDHKIGDKKHLLATMKRQAGELEQQLQTMIQLVNTGELPKVGFKKHYEPVFEQLQQIEEELPRVEADIDFLTIQKDSSGEVLEEAKDLYERWPRLDFKEKRAIIETILNHITVGKDDLEIDLAYLVPSPELMVKASHHPRGSKWHVFYMNI